MLINLILYKELFILTFCIFVGITLVAGARISKWIRISTGKQKLLDGSTQSEVIMTYIGWALVFIPIILSIN